MEKHQPQRVNSPQIHICDIFVAHLFALLQLHWGKLSDPFSQADAYRDWSRSCSAQAPSHHHKWQHLPLTLLTPKSPQHHQEGMKMKQSSHTCKMGAMECFYPFCFILVLDPLIPVAALLAALVLDKVGTTVKSSIRPFKYFNMGRKSTLNE